MDNAITLKDAVKEHPICFANDDDTLTLVHSIRDVLESGVKELSLKVSEKTGRVVVDENCYKAVSCTNVKVSKVSDRGRYGSKTEAKASIECASWHFPCPDYKYSNIKRNLELSICAISGVRDVEVKSFMTGIVEYDVEL